MAYAKEVLAEFASTGRWSPATQLRAASLHAAQEYVGRFLYELVQNGHDASCGGEGEGRLKVLLDLDEGEHGTVYAANAGAPFTLQGLESLCKLAASAKSFGDGIGHKGVGFRSVLSVCEWPEVYSTDLRGRPGNVDGYSFRFARHDDFLELVEGDAELAARAAVEMPQFQVPVPITGTPDAVRRMLEDGYVTVIRLALDTPNAMSAAMHAMTELGSPDAPILLFLGRVGTLELETRSNGAIERQLFTRAEVPFQGAPRSRHGLRYGQVDLGSGGRFVVASVDVDPRRVRAAVDEAKAARLLPENWSDWDAAVVSIAGPCEGAVDGRTFTFLPLRGQSRSPFAGHLNAPFFTKLDRGEIDVQHPLNALLLDVAAEACLAAAMELRSAPSPASAVWVTDLACWGDNHRERLRRAAPELTGEQLCDLPVVPVWGAPGCPGSWASCRDVFRWPRTNLRVLVPERATAHGACLLDEGIGPARAAAWHDFGAWLGCPLDPDPAALADWVVAILADLPRPVSAETLEPGRGVGRRRTGTRSKRQPSGDASTEDARAAEGWAAAYADLVELFPADPACLQGRRLLVDDTGELRDANAKVLRDARRRGASAFLPPTRDDASIALPASFRRRLFYLHPTIAERLAPAVRTFLTDRAEVIHAYETRGLLHRVQQVLASSESVRLHRDALRFVFTLHRAGQARSNLRDLGLRLPRPDGGLVAAARAVFGPGWPNRHGDDVQTVIEEADGCHAGLGGLAEVLVVPSAELVRRGDKPTEWAAFLSAIGVTDGLPARVTSAPTPKLHGRLLQPTVMLSRLRLPEAITEQWRAHLANRPAVDAAYPETPYVATFKPVWLLGQEVACHLSARGRAAYARLVLHGLTHWPSTFFETRWERDRPGDKDPHVVPTPLASFLAGAPWAPAAPRDGGPETFNRLVDIWHVPSSTGEALPTYADLLTQSARNHFDRYPRALERAQAACLAVWDDPLYAARQVRHLGQVAAQGRVHTRQAEAFRRAYQRAWANLAAPGRMPLRVSDDLDLVYDRGERLEARRVDELRANQETLHLAPRANGLPQRLLGDLQLPTLRVDGNLEAVRDQLAAALGGFVRVVGDRDVAVLAEPAGAADDLGTPLLAALPWLGLLVASAADHASGFTLREREFAQLADLLRETRVRQYRHLRLRLFDHVAELPASRAGVLAAPDEGGTLIHVPVPSGTLTGAQLVVVAEEVAAAVQRPALRDGVRAAVLELLDGRDDQPRPTKDDLARVLRLLPAQVEATRYRLDGGLEAVISRLYPVLVHWAGRERADEAADAARQAADLADLPAVLGRFSWMPPGPTSELVDAAREADSVGALRAALGIDFAEFNRTLAALAPEHAPTSHRDAHEQNLLSFLNLHRRELTDVLRWARLADFDAQRAQRDWPELRSLEWLDVPHQWDHEVEATSNELLAEHVASALCARLGSDLPEGGEALEPIDALRPANRTRVTRTSPRLCQLARAWAAANRKALPTPLANEDGAALADLLDAAGALDFRPLTEDDIASWFAVLGAWPPEMPTTKDAEVLDLTEAQVEEASTAQAQERQARDRARRLVHVADADIDIADGDLALLIEALERSLAAGAAILSSSTRFADLASSASKVGPRDPSGQAPTPTCAASPRLSEAQRNAVGFAGEWFALRWLFSRYPEANETSWVSMNRRHVYGDRGDDALGYDLRVERSRGPLMFEVKANLGEPGDFNLTESEIRAAQRNAQNDRWRLLVVAHVFDPSRRRLLVLPNPFGRRGADHFRVVGQGLRISYRLAELG